MTLTKLLRRDHLSVINESRIFKKKGKWKWNRMGFLRKKVIIWNGIDPWKSVKIRIKRSPVR